MTTASNVFGDRNAFCSWSAIVDSALPGSHDFASFFSAPDSLPASGPSAATTMTQNNRTRYFVRRPTITRVTALLTTRAPKPKHPSFLACTARRLRHVSLYEDVQLVKNSSIR